MSRFYIEKDPCTPYFVTLTIVEWVDIFTRTTYQKIITDSLLYCQQHKSLKIHAYVLMSNHLHAIISSGSENITLSDILRDFKKFTAKAIIQALQNDNRYYILPVIKYYGQRVRQAYQVWQHDSHPEIIENADFLEQKLNYIHLNPVRKMIVEKPEDYLLSSARDYCDDYEMKNPFILIDRIDTE